MSGSQRGEKRTCPSCGVRFYDLDRRPIACPGCESEFSVDDFVRPRRQRAPEPPTAKSEEPVASASPAADGADQTGPAEGVVAAEAKGEDVEDIEDDEEDESVIEDASELGEDDDDMAEVIVKVVEPEKTEER